MSITVYTGQLQKKYTGYLRGLVLGLPFEPIVLRGGKNKPGSTVALHQGVQEFQQFDKTATQPGWQIEWESWNSKALGRQQWPAIITVPTEDDLLYLLKKQTEAAAFINQVRALLSWRPFIQPWLAENTGVVLSLQSAWPGIMAVVDVIAANNVSGYYLRNLPVPVHTKFIETHQSVILALLRYLQPERFNTGETKLENAIGVRLKPMVFPLRWLDATLGRAHHYPADVAGITAEALRLVNWPVTEIWLVENETALYMLPAWPGTVAICSRGYALAQFADIPLLRNTDLFYWGDMDEDGFTMLHQCRLMYPHVQSRYMDAATLDAHVKEIDVQPATYRRTELAALTGEERMVYEQLMQRNGRLEQEKIGGGWIGR